MTNDAPDWRKVEMAFEAGDPAMSEDFPDWVKGISVAEESPIGGLAEGDYTEWALKWIKDTPDSAKYTYENYFAFLIDERTEVLNLVWYDQNGILRFGVYNLSDFSIVFESSGHYVYSLPALFNATYLTLGNVMPQNGGISRSLQSYILLATAADYNIVEVWRGGSSALWNHNLQDDVSDGYLEQAGISLTGKYVLLCVRDYDTPSPYVHKLLLYEGS